MTVVRMSTSAPTPMFADPVPYVRISRAVIAATARRDTMAMDGPSRVASISMSVPARRADAMRIASTQTAASVAYAPMVSTGIP